MNDQIRPIRGIPAANPRFFGDPERHEALAHGVIADLLAHGDPSTPVLVWVAGCATGEEAYSVAILFREAGL